jgi:hypothetical protein
MFSATKTDDPYMKLSTKVGFCGMILNKQGLQPHHCIRHASEIRSCRDTAGMRGRRPVWRWNTTFGRLVATNTDEARDVYQEAEGAWHELEAHGISFDDSHLLITYKYRTTFPLKNGVQAERSSPLRDNEASCQDKI